MRDSLSLLQLRLKDNLKGINKVSGVLKTLIP